MLCCLAVAMFMLACGIAIQQSEQQNAIGTQTEGQRERDPGAEWWVAFWTFAPFIATTGLWFFTGLMWLATRRAVDEGQQAIAAARETAEATVSAARATSAQVDVMERALRTNLASAEYADSRTKQINRAYLSVEPIGVTPIDAPRACTLMDIAIANHGNTPGFLSILHIECSENEPTGMAAFQSLLDSADVVVGPDKTTRHRLELEIYFSGDQTYYVFGFIEYSDIYGDGPHYTRFCYRADPNRFYIAGPADWRWRN